MDRFFYSPGACSLAVHAVLQRTGRPFERVKIDTRAGEQRMPGYLAVNPKGRVPALMVGAKLITELPAIMTFLAERDLQLGLQPAGDVERAMCLSWMCYLQSTIHPFFQALWRPNRFSEDTESHAAINVTAKERLVEEWKKLDDHLAHAPCLLGAQVSVCDYNLFALARWTPAICQVKRDLPNVYRFVITMAADPAIKEVLRVEEVTLLREGF